MECHSLPGQRARSESRQRWLLRGQLGCSSKQQRVGTWQESCSIREEKESRRKRRKVRTGQPATSVGRLRAGERRSGPLRPALRLLENRRIQAPAMKIVSFKNTPHPMLIPQFTFSQRKYQNNLGKAPLGMRARHRQSLCNCNLGCLGCIYISVYSGSEILGRLFVTVIQNGHLKYCALVVY